MVLGAIRGRSLQLDRHVIDPEFLVCDVPDAGQHHVRFFLVIGIHDHVRGERFVSGGQSPDVHIVNDGHARQLLDHAAETIDVDVGGNALQQHMDHLRQQAPGTQQDQDGHHGAGDRVGHIPVVGPHEYRRDDHRHRPQQIGDHVAIGGLDVDAVFGGGVEHPRDQGVDAEPGGPDDQHQTALDLVTVITGDPCRDAVIRLHQHQRRHDPEGEGVHQGRQDLRAMIAESTPGRG